ncbi:MAG: HD domain-containing protein [Lachnospiraceae bacterium]|nr:HD domain-containing protein [Lachnospiraceae bacterium]
MQTREDRKRKRNRERTQVAAQLQDLTTDEHVLEMKRYIQHGRISTYAHCEEVALASYRINRRLHLKADEKVLLRAAMLHDFYLYDWHDNDGTHPLHGYRHADQAMENAKRFFHIGETEQMAIWSHMWPLNITRLPRTREAWILCIADKLVSFEETVLKR